MSIEMSVLDRARAMTAEASRLRQGADAEYDASRVSERIGEVTLLLTQLGQVVGAVTRLRHVTGSECVDLSGLDDGRAAFARHAAGGLPSNQVFTAAKQKINGVIARVSSQLSAEWSGWIAGRMTELPLLRIALLDSEQQRSARSDYDELQRLAKIAIPTSTDISMFQSAAGLLAETLAQVADLPADVQALLRRLGERPPLTLDELTDEQISMLRQADIANQIEVRRRGT